MDGKAAVSHREKLKLNFGFEFEGKEPEDFAKETPGTAWQAEPGARIA
jgi:hypothetical protein